MDRQLLMPNHPSELRTMRPTDCLCALRCIRPVVLGVVLFVLTTIGVFVVLVSSPATVSTTLALFPTVRQSGLHSARIPRPLPGVGQRTARHVHTPALRDIEAPVAKLPQEANPQSFIGHSRTHVPLPAPWSFSLGLGLLLLLSAPLLLMRARFCTRTRYPDIALMAVTGESYSSVRRPLSMQQRATHSVVLHASDTPETPPPPPHDDQELAPAAKEVLDRISIVCCEPQGAQNVGGAARALQNFGLSSLRVVAPPGGITEQNVLAPGRGEDGPVAFVEDAYGFAVTADWILDATAEQGTFGTTQDAIGDCAFVLGTSVRQRGQSMPFLTPREAARRILAEARAGARVAVLFGNERTGLTANDLKLAHGCIYIPTQTRPGQATPTSLNLSHALAIVCYELYHESLGQEGLQRISADVRKPGTVLDSKGRDVLVGELVAALRAAAVTDYGPGASEAQEEWDGVMERVWEDAMGRLLSAGTVELKDSKALFALARRMVALGTLSQRLDQELPLARLVRRDLQQRVDAGEFGGLPSPRQVGEHLRTLNMGMTKREVELLIESLVPPQESTSG